MRSLVVVLTLVLVSPVLPGVGPSLAARELTCDSFRTLDAARRAEAAGLVATAALDADGDGNICEDRFDPEPGDHAAVPPPEPVVSPADVDCDAFAYQQSAQQVLERNRADAFNLDPSGDGIACSSLPSRAVGGQRAAAPATPADQLAAGPVEAIEPAETKDPIPASPAEPPRAPGSPLRANLDLASEDIDAFWATTFSARGWSYTSPEIRMFQTSVRTACGPVETSIGPFYCPRDQTIYVDMPIVKEIDFFQDPYVVRTVFAHEWAHHVQYLSGYEVDLFPDERGEVLSLQLELHADCLAGVWAASTIASGEATEDDLLNAMTLAYAGGDGPEVPLLAPDAHGTSEMRLGAFVMGLEAGKPQLCEREILKLL